MKYKPNQFIVIAGACVAVICVCLYETSKKITSPKIISNSLFQINNDVRKSSTSFTNTLIKEGTASHKYERIGLENTNAAYTRATHLNYAPDKSRKYERREEAILPQNQTNDAHRGEYISDIKDSYSPSHRTRTPRKDEENDKTQDNESKISANSNAGITRTDDNNGTQRWVLKNGLAGEEAMQEWLGSRGQVFRRRALAVERVCDQYHVHQSTSDQQTPAGDLQAGEKSYMETVTLGNFLLGRSASTLTCLINKVASTSLASSLLLAEHVHVSVGGEDGSTHIVAAARLKPQSEEELRFALHHFFKFLLVRHPFARLLSAYRDKVEKAEHWSLRKLRRHIITTLAERQAKQGARHATGRLQEQTEAGQEKGEVKEEQEEVVPTFSDFLEYILLTNETGGGFDSHWRPYWGLCAPCSVRYHAIAKLETVYQDLKPIWWRMGLSDSAVPWFNPSNPALPSLGTTQQHHSVPSSGNLPSPTPRPLQHIDTPLPTSSLTRSPQYHSVSASGSLPSPTPRPLQHIDGAPLTRSPQQHSDAAPKAAPTSRYYQGLHPQLIARIYHHFALDFKLFEYDILDVYREGGHCQTHDCSDMMFLIV